ncbi:MAG: tetratricopeptide repeat protein, partial [Burkholderiales bacterium]|nr:tetratricopeptide repeat protein [Burkholderiales bacterium]
MTPEEIGKKVAMKTGLRVADAGRFERFVLQRAKLLGFGDLDGYAKFLEGKSQEWQEIARFLSSSETFFFRDHGQFELLRRRIFPELFARHAKDKTLRIWSAGCASGEEAYSLAILIDFILPEREEWNISIFGTDIDSQAIEKAKAGRFRKWSFRSVPTEWLQNHFRQEGEKLVLSDRIRDMVRFSVLNLVGDPFPDLEFRDMDLILCRNVFIYFDPQSISLVASRFAASLRSGGYLLTAHTELIGQRIPGLSSLLFPEGVLYRKENESPLKTEIPLPLPTKTSPAAIESVPGETRQTILRDAPPSPMLEALEHANRGRIDPAEASCRKAIEADPLDAAPYFLLAQIEQMKGNPDAAEEFLKKTLYLEPEHVAAHLELAALKEKKGDAPRAKSLRQAALSILRAMPDDELVHPYETSAGEIAIWLDAP